MTEFLAFGDRKHLRKFVRPLDQRPKTLFYLTSFDFDCLLGVAIARSKRVRLVLSPLGKLRL
jgi:hypothetical protein